MSARAPSAVNQPLAAAEFGRVAVLYGGTSSERAVSLDSGRNVLDALRRSGVAAEGVDGIGALLAGIAVKRYDRVFNIMHGGDGENGIVQGLLEALGVPYTGSRVLGSALTLDKIRTKQVWLALGLPPPSYQRLAPGADVATSARQLGFPLIVGQPARGFERRRQPRLQPEPAAGRGHASREVRRRVADGNADRGWRVHGRHPRRRGAALDPDRAGGRVLRLPRQVRFRCHPVCLSWP